MPTNNVLGTFTKPFLSLVNVVADKPSQNFVWKPAPTISGRVMRSGTGTGVQGVAIAFSAVGVVTTGLGGVYSQTVPSGWSGTATATFTNGRFSAASRTYRNVTADKTLQNYTWIAPTVVPHATVVTQAAPAAQILAFPSAILMRSRGTVRWTGSDAAQLRALGGEVAIRLVAGAGTVCLPIPVSAPGDADWNLSIEANAIEFLGTLDAELVDIFLANGQAAARAPRYGTTMSGPVNLQDDGDTIVLNWDLTLTR
jgi:hypothetical protein